MRLVSPAQEVLFSIWMFLSLPKLFKSKVIDKHGFVLMMKSSYLNLGVTSEILNRLIQVMSAVQCAVYICFSQKQHPTADCVQNESRTALR